jgi:riboflavin synthase
MRVMFTGIVTDVGRVRSRTPGGTTRIVLETAYDTATIALGASIACGGCCLSVVDKGPGWFAVDASGETLTRTTLGAWRAGAPVNLERPLKLGDELGGHMVLGHVDGVAEVVERRPDGDSLRYAFRAPPELARYLAPKGSVAIDGVSLTVNEVEGAVFGVNIIPVTQRETTFGRLAKGDRVNLEIDLLARYLARLVDKERT